MDDKECVKEIILKEYNEGNIVLISHNGLVKHKLDDFVNQPIE